MCHNYNKNVSNYTDGLDIQGRNEKTPIISRTFPLAVSCTLSRKQDIDFGNQGEHMLIPVPSFIRIERGSDGGP